MQLSSSKPRESQQVEPRSLSSDKCNNRKQQVVNCTQPFHRIILLVIKNANLLSKFPRFFCSGFVSHTSTRALKSLRDLVLQETAANCAKWKPHGGSLSRLAFQSDIESEFWSEVKTLQSREKTHCSCILTVPSRPLFMLSLLAPILPLPPGEHRVGELQGSYLRSPSFPSSSNFCCLVLWNLGLTQDQRMVIHVQQVPVPWKPPFSPQNIPFYPFWRPVTG